MFLSKKRRENNSKNKKIFIRVNYSIKTKEVRVISNDGAQLGVMTTIYAINKSKSMNLDLVEVNPLSVPPVCKIMDFGKYKYEQKRKISDAKKKQKIMSIKEIKFRPRIDKHDFDIKISKIINFLKKGNKCKIVMMFKGRELIHKEIGLNIIDKINQNINKYSSLISLPKLDGKSIISIIVPLKNIKKNREEK